MYYKTYKLFYEIPNFARWVFKSPDQGECFRVFKADKQIDNLPRQQEIRMFSAGSGSWLQKTKWLCLKQELRQSLKG